MLRNTRARYGLASKALHWLLAAGILGLTGLGAWMVTLGYFDSWYNRALALHRSGGMIVLGLALLFAAWKVVSPSPPLQAGLRGWERAGAATVHALLLGAMVVVPASGYVISTSAGSGFPFLGRWEVPALLPRSDTVRDLAIVIHAAAAYAVLPLVAVHAGAALKHQFIDRHGTLRRML